MGFLQLFGGFGLAAFMNPVENTNRVPIKIVILISGY